MLAFLSRSYEFSEQLTNLSDEIKRRVPLGHDVALWRQDGF